MTTMDRLNVRRLLALLLALALLAAACSSDDAASGDATTDDTEPAEAEPETTEPETTEPPETAPADTEPETTEPAETEPEASGGQAVDLSEWVVDTAATLAPGTVSFDVSNSGENPHAFAIAKGDSYENLPQLENGAVDTEALGADFLGTTENLQTGESTSIEFTLEAGNYVFFCPVQFGPNSHAAAGQVLSVTVG